MIINARKSTGEHGIDRAVDKLNALPNIKGRAVGMPANNADLAEIERMVRETQSLTSALPNAPASGRLDILVANAAATWGGAFEPTPDWSTSKILDLNVRAVFNLIQKFTPLLTASGTNDDPSRVIVTSSVAAVTVPHVGPQGTIMYAASKAAASHLARQLALELAPKITVNAISPGFFPSKLASGLIEILGGEEAEGAKNPRGRLGRPEDIGALVVWLCGRGGAYVNGVDVQVDGGARLGRRQVRSELKL